MKPRILKQAVASSAEANKRQQPSSTTPPSSSEDKQRKPSSSRSKRSQIPSVFDSSSAQKTEAAATSPPAEGEAKDAAQPAVLSPVENGSSKEAQPAVSTPPPYPASPAKRGAAECAAGSQMAEKRSRAHSPSRDLEEEGRSLQTEQQGNASPPADCTPETVQPTQHEEMPFRHVPRLNLEQVVFGSATHAAEPMAARQDFDAYPSAPACHTPSPAKAGSPQDEGESDEELASWNSKPRWEPETEQGGHVYRAVSSQELRQYQQLLEELEPSQAQQVMQYWEAMWQARQSCEKMSSRGVRATKDVMQAWSEITSDLTDRVERSEQQVQELMLLVQRQANTIEALHMELVRKGHDVSHDSSRHTSQRGAGESADADVLQRLQEVSLTNAQLSRLNAELVQKMDHVNLMCTKAQSDSARLARELALSKERCALLEQQPLHQEVGAGAQQQQQQQTPTPASCSSSQSRTHGRYGPSRSNQSAHPSASRSNILPPPAYVQASPSSWEQLQQPKEPIPFDVMMMRRHRPVADAERRVGIDQLSGLQSAGLGLRSAAQPQPLAAGSRSSLGQEHQRTAFRAMLRRGGIL